TASKDQGTWLWNLDTGQPVGAPIVAPRRAIQTMTFSPDSKMLLTGSEIGNQMGEAQLWDAATALPLGEPLAHRRSVEAAAFAPDGKAFLLGSGPEAQLWDAATRQPLGKPLAHRGTVRAAAFSSDGRRVLTAAGEGRLWDVTMGQLV